MKTLPNLPNNWQPDENTIWWNISRDYKLSESFIRKYQDEVDWLYISANQNLSEEFIREFKDKVYWYSIFICQKHISHRFLNKYQHLINFYWTGIRRKYF